MSEDDSFSLVTPFWIDTDSYTDRDRLMFVCGVEFEIVLNLVKTNPDAFSRPIHRENESRIRMLCGQSGRQCTTTVCSQVDDPNGTWSHLEVRPS